jgi:hypothetical protein
MSAASRSSHYDRLAAEVNPFQRERLPTVLWIVSVASLDCLWPLPRLPAGGLPSFSKREGRIVGLVLCPLSRAISSFNTCTSSRCCATS